jgi:hypothetical protein
MPFGIWVGAMGSCGKSAPVFKGTGGALPALSCQIWKMHDLTATNGGQDLDDLQAGCFGNERIINTQSGLLEGGKMKSSSIGDELDGVAPGRRITVGDRREVHQVDNLWKSVAEIRVAGAAVFHVPTGIHGEISSASCA